VWQNYARVESFYTVKNARISTDISRRLYTEPVPLKYGKLATKFPWIYGYFYSVQCSLTVALNFCTFLRLESKRLFLILVAFVTIRYVLPVLWMTSRFHSNNGFCGATYVSCV